MHWLLCVLAALTDGGQSTGPPAPPDSSAQSALPSGQAGGQTVAPPDAQPDDVVIVGRRGAADVPPELEYGPTEIDALGAYDINEVIRRTAEANALGDAPVVIVNGRRVADASVFLNFPPDALTRVEVLPPQAGALYGGSDPTRRVLNIVLQQHFHSRDGQLAASSPTAGGTSTLSLDARQGAISDNNVTQFGVRGTRVSPLFAAERPDYLRDNPGEEASSLLGESKLVGGNLALSRALGDWSASLNFQPQVNESRSVSLGADGPMENGNTARSLSATGGLNGEMAGWSLQGSLSGAISHAHRTGLASSTSDQQSLNATVSANRKLVTLPAGPLIVNLTAMTSRSRSTTDTASGRQVFPSHSVGFNGNLSIPLWKAPVPGSGSLPARLLGSMTATVSGSARQSDAGRGSSLNASLAWAPLRKLRVNGTWSTSTDSLSDAQRFTPEYFGLPTTVFDFATGESVQVLPILGGTPDLRQPQYKRLSLSAFIGPFTPWAVAGGINLQRSNAVDGLGSLPTVTPELEAAFPERFQRDAQGRLQYIDQRPINFDSAQTESVAPNLSLSIPLGGKATGGRRGSLRVALNDNWQLRNLTVIHAGLPEMNRLSGDGGGMSRHQVSAQMDGRLGQWGANLATRWRSGYRIRRESGQDSGGDLLIGAISMIDLRLSYFTQHIMPAGGAGAAARHGIGMQLALEINNLFDARPGARLGNGQPAPGYGRDDQDPLGRTIRLTLRRRF